MEQRQKALKASNALYSKTRRLLIEAQKFEGLSIKQKQYLLVALTEIKRNAEEFSRGEQFFLGKNPKRSDWKLASGRVGFISRNLGKLRTLLRTIAERDQVIDEKTYKQLDAILASQNAQILSERAARIQKG